MGRGLTDDPLFFGAALAGGVALAELAPALSRHSPGAVEQAGSQDRGAVALEAKLDG